MRRRRIAMNNKRLYLDVHALQVLPPSCVNRDDTNTPKICIYGGKVRARVSSQCWKRAARMYMKEHELEDIGVRTRKFKNLVEKELTLSYSFTEEEAQKAAEAALKISNVASDREDAKAVIAFFSKLEIAAFAKAIAERKNDILSKKPSKEVTDLLVDAVRNNPSTDILLFGRMFAGDSSLNYDAACQVAHAISVNEAKTEYDYFAAVDDIPDETNSGSAFLDTKQFTDPILYRYANVNLSDTSELVRFDKDNAAKAARDFVEAFVLSMPTGSGNGYANATLPEYVVVALRDDMPVSFAPAFIKTVTGDDYEISAENKMQEYSDKISANYGAPVLVLSLKDMPFKEILDTLFKEIKRRLEEDADTTSEI